MYGDVVLGLKPESKDEIDPFEEILEQKKHARGVKLDTELDRRRPARAGRRVQGRDPRRAAASTSPRTRRSSCGAPSAPSSARGTTTAPIAYRKLNDIPESWGTAVNVQAMVFGNLGDDSGTGVAFTRDPATGENVFYGEYLMNAQGEDVVAGIAHAAADPRARAREPDRLPPAPDASASTLERHYRDMQDIEFTIQQGTLYMLQCRDGKRTGSAAVRIAVDMVNEGLIAPKRGAAARRARAAQPAAAARSSTPADKERAVREQRLLAKGLNAGPGAAAGRIYFHADEAEAAAGRGEPVILVRIETTPEDIRGMEAAQGILTARGGMTSHAALVARQMGKVCVAGCEALRDRLRSRARCASPAATRAARGRLICRSTAPPARCSAAASRPSRARSCAC